MTVTWRIELGLSAPSDAFTLDELAEAVLDTDVLGDDAGRVWTDVTEYVLTEQPITWRRGAARSQGPWWRYEGGTASFTLDNLDGRFDPTNLAGPYVSGGVSDLRPSLPVRISIVRSGVADLQWRGVVDVWPIDQASTTWSQVTVLCVDGAERLQQADLPELASEVGADETVGARIGRILDRVGWPLEDRDVIDDGDMTVQATTMAQPAWTELLLTADSAGGYLYLSREGVLTFRPRGTISPEPVARFGCATGIDVAALTPALDKEQVVNLVGLARKGSTEQVVEDLDSQALIGEVRAHRRSDLVCSNDAQVMSLATEILARWSELAVRVESLSVDVPLDVTSTAWNELVALELGQTVRTTWSTADGRTVVRDGVVRSVEWTVGTMSARVDLSVLQAPAVYAPFLLDDAAVGVLDTSTLALR